MTENVLPRSLPRARQSQTLLLFGGTLFVSAACMFMVQPMMGKMLLPLVGGTPAGWIVAMAFFQVMLLAGYALAYGLSRFTPRVHGLFFIGALAVGSLFLPVTLPQAVDGTANAGLVFRLLATALGVPFIALAATSSTIQRLFAATRHDDARDPYFLYAASNLGSFTGLLLYPGAAEPHLTLPEQSHLWFFAYALLIVLCATCLCIPERAVSVRRQPAPTPVPLKRRLHWIALAFFPSSLMLGVTSHITTDVISAPMVWVLPLGLYLLTFVIAFSKKPVVSYDLVRKLHPTVVALAVALLIIINGFTAVSFAAMGWHLFAFTVTALLCHLRLAQLRPLDDERRLPDYYLMIALGGALGGILNAFIAPLVFDSMAEYPVILLLSCLMNPGIRAPFSFRYGLPFLLGACGMMAAAAFRHETIDFPMLRNALLTAIFVLVTFHPRATLIAGAFVYLVSQFYFSGPDVRLTRDFYGVIRVYERTAVNDGKTYHLRLFRHGTTTHSTQLLDPGMETTTTAYYSKQGPVGDIFNAFHPRRVAVMGLGAGTLACYATPDSAFTFFEIDPAVVDMARKQFSYLERCHGAEPNRVITGDARLELAKLGDEKFDLIVLDAFSSDMVPVHLVSQEALRLYLDHLTDHGIIAFNLSSRYVRLEDMLAAGAQATGLINRYRDDETSVDPFILPTMWMIMARSTADVAPLTSPQWVAKDTPPGFRPWTDGYSSVASVVRF